VESLSISDIKDDIIHIRTKKTDKPVAIPLNATIKRILNKYKEISKTGLPRMISNQKMNQHLKELCKLAGIDEMIKFQKTKGGKPISQTVPKYEKITTHTARRSFATNLYLENFSTISIMKITGHQTESAFMSYIRVTPLEHAQKLREFYKSNGEL
jgi:integrase